MVGGRKLVGRAQRRTSCAFLQHGSLLVGPAHERIVELLLDTRRDTALAASMRAKLGRGTVTLGGLLGEVPRFDQLVSALVRGFETVLQVHAAL
jgi:lipoate-protein ligase A